MKRYVIYDRKSKESDNGLISHTFATQEWAVENFLKAQGKEGVDWVVVKRFAETVTGSGYYTKRKLFTEAVNMCKADKSLTLLSSKPDRIARNLRSATELMETINIAVATMPSASDMELHVVFMMAEQEWKNTSERWKAMHAAKKARGEKVGAAHPSYNRDKLTARNKRTNTVARTHAEKYRASVELMVDMKMSLRGIAGKLAEIGAKTQQGKLYTHNSVNNLCKLLDIDRKTFKLGGSVELVV